MKGKIISVILFTVVLAGTVFFFALFRNKKEGQVCFKKDCFKVELATTQKERAQGLMFRKSLKENEGMLFVFENEGKYTFWMKNTLIPLDIIWIDKEGKVVFISENAQPCFENDCPLIAPDNQAQYILEIKGGVSKNIDLKIRDIADIKIPSVAKFRYN